MLQLVQQQLRCLAATGLVIVMHGGKARLHHGGNINIAHAGHRNILRHAQAQFRQTADGANGQPVGGRQQGSGPLRQGHQLVHGLCRAGKIKAACSHQGVIRCKACRCQGVLVTALALAAHLDVAGIDADKANAPMAALQQGLRQRGGGGAFILQYAAEAQCRSVLTQHHQRALQDGKGLAVLLAQFGGQQQYAVDALFLEQLQGLELTLGLIVGMRQQQAVACRFQHGGNARHHGADAVGVDTWNHHAHQRGLFALQALGHGAGDKAGGGNHPFYALAYLGFDIAGLVEHPRYGGDGSLRQRSHFANAVGSLW